MSRMLATLELEIEGVPAYLAESERLTRDTTVLQKAQATTIGAKIQCLKSLTLQEATRLKVSIAQVGWESDINERLSELVDEAVAKCFAESSQKVHATLRPQSSSAQKPSAAR